ncbi:MAG: beta-lactamase family protein [Chloroflexales bacterium]|nr:beta-lactamase family protein [Chloroflexales bacterium]
MLKSIIVMGGAALVLLATCSGPSGAPLQSETDRAAHSITLDKAADIALIPATVFATPYAQQTLTPSPNRRSITPSIQLATTAPSPTMSPSPTSSPFPPTPTFTPDSVVASIDTHLQELTDLNLFSGSVLVAQSGTVLLNKGYGLANYEHALPNTHLTRFRLASLTKSFTALAILLLQDQGALAVQDSVCAYLPDCRAAWQPITIHHLLTHTSGIPNYTDFAGFANIEMSPATPAQLIALFDDFPLEFAPGSAYRYGNSGYVLLGAIIENVTGQSYADFLHEAIFAPLRMNNTGFAASTPGSHEAAGYANVGAPAKPLDPSTLFAAGGLYSTVEDLYLWDQALYTDSLIAADVYTAMVTPFRNNYGYGWKVSDHVGRLRVAHSGIMSGSATYLARYSEDMLTIIVLSNLENAAVEDMGNYIAWLIFASG